VLIDATVDNPKRVADEKDKIPRRRINTVPSKHNFSAKNRYEPHSAATGTAESC
jgi:hypothetical protein